jgi:hypothetical protein
LLGKDLVGPESTVFFILILFSLYYFRFSRKVKYKLSSFMIYVLFFSVFTLIEVNRFSIEKNISQMKMLAVSLSTEHDPVAELLFVDLEKELSADEEISDLLYADEFDFQRLFNTVERKYFRGFWDKYDLQLTICGLEDSVFVAPPEEQWYPCYSFFYDTLLSNGSMVPNTGVYFLDNLNGRISYFMALPYREGTPEEVTLFLELDSRLVLEGLGYPSLLLDESLQPENPDFSYAKYNKEELITSSGEFKYSTGSDVYPLKLMGFSKFRYDKFDHIAYRVDGENTIIVSKHSVFWVDLLISFSYIFSFYFIVLVLIDAEINSSGSD